MKKTVLIVDDNSANLYLLKNLLEGEGFKVIEAENGKEALDKAQTHLSDLIVSDILMPVMDGYALCRACKSDERLQSIPFVFYTATYTEPTDEQFALSLGADRFLIKPQDPEALLEELKKILEQFDSGTTVAKGQFMIGDDFIRQHHETVSRKLYHKIAELQDLNVRLSREIEEKEKAEAKYRQIFENAIEGIYQSTPEGRYISVNPAFARMFGFSSPEEMMVQVTHIGKQLYVHFEDRERVKAALDDPGYIKGFEAEVRRKDGTIFWISINAHAVRDAGGTILYYEGTNTDITENKRAEQHLSFAKEKFLRFFHSNPIPTAITDFSTGRLLDINETWEKVMGFTADEVIGRKTTELELWVDPDARNRMFAAVDSEQKVTNFEAQVRNRSGDISTLLFSGHKLRLGEEELFFTQAIDITQQRETEAELQKLAFVVKFSSELVNIVTLDGKMLFLNDAGCKMLGIDSADVTGMNIMEVIPDHLQETVKNELLPALKNGGIWEGNLQYIHRKTGKLTDVFATTFPIKDPISGLPLYMANVSRDITESKRIVQQLQESESRYRELANFLPQIVFETDVNGNITFINEASSDLSGYTVDEFTGGMNLLHLTVPEDRERLAENIRQVLSGETPENNNYSVVRKDGRIIPVATRAVPIVRDGKILGLRGIGIDITDIRAAEDALKESEKRYRFLTEKMTDIVWLMDMNLRTVYVSSSIEKVFGFTPEERIRQEITEQLTPESLSVMYDTLARELALEQEDRADPDRSIILEVEAYHKDGSTRWIDNVVSGIRDHLGVLTGFHGVSRDITEHKKVENDLEKTREQLIQAEKLAALGQLSAGVAHEILNPVNIISMELQVLQMMGNLPAEVLEEFSVCMSQIDRIVAIAENLKQVSRPSAKKTGMAKINGIIAHILTLWTSQFKINEIELDLQYQPDLPEIVMDKKKIEQVILNLISNARDAMEGKENKVLHITTGMDEGHENMILSVADTGGGIKDEHILKIFDPFFTTKEEGKGTGLGLSISYGIVKDHGGRIWAENNAWGGASFYISLPMKTTMDETHA